MTAWPATRFDGPVVIRPLSRRDRRVWSRVRLENATWLAPWEATAPDPSDPPPSSFHSFASALLREARGGTAMPFVIEYEGELVGQVSVTGIVRGSLCAASIGYWVARRVAGRGIVPTAVAMAADHAWTEGGLHRLEVAIRPDNVASLRVVEKLGFRDEGVRRRYLHIAGDWRDHRVFALNAEDLPGGLLARWRASRPGG